MIFHKSQPAVGAPADLCYKITHMRSIFRLILVAAGIWLAGFLAGCTSSPMVSSPGTKESLEPSKFEPLTDIPIPSGSKLDPDNSLILGGPENWVGRAVLNVNLSMADATVFYQKQMPSFGWDLVTVTQGKITSMTFTRPERVASLQIEPKTFGGSSVTIIMAPRQPKTEPKPEAAPAPQVK